MNIHAFPQPHQSGLRTLSAPVDARRQQLEAAAEQFEALFLQQILKQMRKAGDVLAADNPMRSRDLDTMRDWYDEALADSLASRGQTGIRDMLVAQLGGAQPVIDEERLSRLYDEPLPQTSAGAFQPVLGLWRRGTEQLAGVWQHGSARFQQLVGSVIRHESGGRVDAISPKGARGLMQLMPDTAREVAAQLGIAYNDARLVNDGDYNRRLGSAYLGSMLDRYAGSEALALAAYNAGPGRVDQWLEVIGDPRNGHLSEAEWVERIPYDETRNYTRSILRDMRAGQWAHTSASLNPGGDTVALSQHRVVGQVSSAGSPAFAQPIRIDSKEPES